ncbi:MAG TPA: VIT1/CCC1 family protein [Candidatus Caenarcaniphilales bacterium]|nr:VIT1/CCC1 family protein [Candidatus Caenarcaniphilales bacterium]
MESVPFQLSPAEQARSVSNLKLERDAIVLYERLASIERDPRRAEAFRRIAVNERRHADIWARRLEEAGVPVPSGARPRARVRLIIGLARIFGTLAVADLVRALEGDEEEAYADQLTPETAAIAADEREHAEIWNRLGGREERRRSRGIRDEAWHQSGRSGTLRAAVFGVNDGLVTNLSLVMGFAGAVSDNRLIVLAGVAGLLAGAFSMAAGEYISMQSQRELFERQIEIEREEMRVMPAEETGELAAIYRGKGLPAHDAQRVATHLMRDPEQALDTKVREELGLDPDELGSPWRAAISSFTAFAVGALVPLAPFLVGSGNAALLAALGLSFLALFVVGALVSLLTGRGVAFSGLRQVGIGAVAAGVTFAVGSAIGIGAA